MKLRPLILKPGYWSGVEDEINSLFWKIFYAPISILLAKRDQFINSESAIVDAIRSGKVSFFEGKFYGSFNAKISKEFLRIGGKFDRRSNTWIVPGLQMPPSLSMAIAEAQMAYKASQKELLQALLDMPDKIEIALHGSKITEEYDKTVTKIDEAYKRTIQHITIPPKLTDASRKRIAEEWGNNLKLYIKKWSDENIISLRDDVLSNAFAGGRAGGLTSAIQKNYNVSKEKARFLARQETSLLMSKFAQQRYAEVGVRKYKWSGSLDERERPDHRLLEGKEFFFDSPPITNRKTGARNNPGEDFGCRCIAVPVIDFE